jgi:hypothetical protein
MAEAGRDLSERDVLVLLADAAGGVIEGRTVFQKLAYFAGRRLHRDFGHRAHYFGPFSSSVESSLKVSVLAGEFDEAIERIPDWYGGPDALKYRCTLSDVGRKRVASLRAEFPDEASTIDEVVHVISDAVPELRQQTLSAAAKIDLIVAQQDEPVPVDELPKLARRLGWHLSRGQVKKTVDVLTRLDLIETGD